MNFDEIISEIDTYAAELIAKSKKEKKAMRDKMEAGTTTLVMLKLRLLKKNGST